MTRFKRVLKTGGDRVGLTPLRIIGYLLHATSIERVFKPRFRRLKTLIELNDEVVSQLPRYSQTITGARMDPMNLVIIGRKQDVARVFRNAGWSRANPASPLHLLFGGLTIVFRRSYKFGPFTPQYVSAGLQDFGYQKLTKQKSFRQRHHVRIWKTHLVLPGKRNVWVAATSYDDSIKMQLTPPFIHHTVNPNIDKERGFLAGELERYGAIRLRWISMTPRVYAPTPTSNASGGCYFTDGRAIALEIPREA